MAPSRPARSRVLLVMAALSGAAGVLPAPPENPTPSPAGVVRVPAQEKTLAALAKARPFPAYQTWWPVGASLSTFLSEAIVLEWSALPENRGDLAPVRREVASYIEVVYGRAARPALVDAFAGRRWTPPLQSGELDALSFAFFRSAFEMLAQHRERAGRPLEVERRSFTQRVGQRFFERLADHLQLVLPPRLDDEASVERLKVAIDRVLQFLKDEGYVRTHAAFRFDVRATRRSGDVVQPESAFLANLGRQGVAYALYEMGYPVILPSAVYLFELVGEAQHHSSRTIEELFARAGCEAREVADFDPRGYPPDLVVELWEIRRR